MNIDGNNLYTIINLYEYTIVYVLHNRESDHRAGGGHRHTIVIYTEYCTLSTLYRIQYTVHQNLPAEAKKYIVAFYVTMDNVFRV